MIEVYKDTTEKLQHKLYLNGARVNSSEPVTLSITDLNTLEVITSNSPAAVETTDGIETYTYIIPLSATAFERKLKATWTYTISGQVGMAKDFIDIVTPYVTPDEIVTAYPKLANKTFDELKDMERLVRAIINGYTGQTFGSRTGTLVVDGTGDNNVALSERVYDIESVSMNGYDLDLTAMSIAASQSGWYLEKARSGEYYDIKADINPFASRHFFGNRYRYVITGKFGYEYVPTEINLAARMLINDYFCSENAWRQKYIKSVRAADWRFEFGSRAFEGTGNADVDRLLDGFTHPRIMVI